MTVAQRPSMAASSRDRLLAQFRGLDPRDPGRWPLLPRLCAWGATLALVLVLGWVTLLSAEAARLQAEREREAALRASYQAKLAQAVNLAALRQQKQVVQQRVQGLERQLPARAEMDALLSEVADAARARGLRIEGFRPGALRLREHHAELPIALRLSGRYHDLGDFAADVAHLQRIVALQDLQLTVQAAATPAAGARAPAPAGRPGDERAAGPAGPPLLLLEATALTFRALEPAEAAEQQRRRQAEAAARRNAGARK
jgi:type IV pilus assembly protein PilO